MGSGGSVSGNEQLTMTKKSGSADIWWATETIALKPAPRVYFPTASSTDSEARTAYPSGYSVQINLDSWATGPVVVNYTVSGTATPGIDYTITPSPRTISTGTNVTSLLITPLQDSLYEIDETVVVTINSASGAYISGNNVFTFIITDDDGPVPSPVIATGASTIGVSPVNYTFPPPASACQLQILKPGGTVVGDFMLAAITRHGSIPSSPDPPITPPDGWTLIRETHNYYSGLTSLTVATYYKIAIRVNPLFTPGEYLTSMVMQATMPRAASPAIPEWIQSILLMFPMLY